MTHRELLALAGRITEHGPEIVQDCRGIPAVALRNYLQANQQQFDAWCAPVSSDNTGDGVRSAGATARDGDLVRANLQEIATSGVLVRVAGTILYCVGARLDIPLATDVARLTVQAYGRAARSSVVSVSLSKLVSAAELEAVDRLGRLCERLSDLLCGALVPHLNCDLFVVDSDRAADFAETFGRFPALVRVPIRRALEWLPRSRLAHAELAAQVTSALLECLPTVARLRSNAPDPFTDLTEMFRPRILRRAEQTTRQDVRAAPRDSASLAFPTFAFSKARRRKDERR